MGGTHFYPLGHRVHNVYCPFMKLKELLLPLMTVEKTWLMWLDSASDRPGTPFGTCGLFSHLSEHGVSYHTVFQAGHHLKKQKNTWVQLIFLRLQCFLSVETGFRSQDY